MSLPHTYWLAGLNVQSDVQLPAVAIGSKSAKPDVVFRRAPVASSLSRITAEFADGECNEDELLLRIPDAARYLMRRGREIVIDEAPGASTGDVVAYLLGTAFGVLCHQRGIPPLHASAIEVPGGCAAFTGDSGSGKSTVVGALGARGYHVLSDDICVLHQDTDGRSLIWPGPTRLRLWEDALNALGYERTEADREFRGFNKYLVPLPAPRDPLRPRNLRRVYQLGRADDIHQATVTRLHGAAAVEVLIENIYRSYLAEHMHKKAALFNVCTAAARTVEVFRFSRPFSFQRMPATLDVLEKHLHDRE